MEESFAGMRMRRRDRLRFRRFTLAQENRQQNQHSGRKKLALPVLERLKPELWIAEIGHRRERGLAMRPGLFRRGLSTLRPVHHERADEEDEQHGPERARYESPRDGPGSQNHMGTRLTSLLREGGCPRRPEG